MGGDKAGLVICSSRKPRVEPSGLVMAFYWVWELMSLKFMDLTLAQLTLSY